MDITPETTRYQALGEVATLTIELAKLAEQRDIKARLAVQVGATPTELAHALAINRASVDRRYYASKRFKEAQAKAETKLAKKPAKKGGKK